MTDLERSIIEELLRMHQQVNNFQQRCLNEILAIERVLNNSLSTHRDIHPKKNSNMKEKVQEDKLVDDNQINKEQAMRKIDQILYKTEEEIKSIEAPNKDKHKFRIEPLPLPQKKPPLPTINRASQKITTQTKYMPQKYIPPRNKNEVTGKVTETPLHRNQKVFKPQRMQSSEKKSQTKLFPNLAKPVNPVNQPLQRRSMDKKQQSQKKIQVKAKSEEKILKTFDFHLQHLSRDMNQILEEAAQKKMKNKRLILQKMINQYEKQYLGYRPNQTKMRQRFLQHYSQFAAIKTYFQPNMTHQIHNRKWQKCPYTFQYEQMLGQLQKYIGQMDVQDDIRVDPKLEYRIVYLLSVLQRELQQIIERSDAPVPDQLQLTFDFNKSIINQRRKQSDSDEMQVKQDKLYDLLLFMFSQITKKDQLTLESLSKIRLLSQTAMHDNRRSAIVLKSDDYSQWRQFYQI